MGGEKGGRDEVNAGVGGKVQCLGIPDSCLRGSHNAHWMGRSVLGEGVLHGDICHKGTGYDPPGLRVPDFCLSLSVVILMQYSTAPVPVV